MSKARRQHSATNGQKLAVKEARPNFVSKPRQHSSLGAQASERKIDSAAVGSFAFANSRERDMSAPHVVA
jgi:hypothetical protein